MPNQNIIFRILVFALVTFILFAANASLIYAQVKSTEIASTFDISDKDAIDGDILISSSTQGIVRATNAYDSRIFGVLQKNPLVVYKRVDNTGSPIVRYSTATVNVTTENGNINPGDYVTSSDIAGKGQKATVSGYVLGIALTGLKDGEGEQITYKSPYNQNLTKKISQGQISMALQIQYAELSNSRSASHFFDSFNSVLFKNVQDPAQFLQLSRYFASGLVVLISFIFAFFTFSRAVSKGVEAVGRNPLAERAIRISIAINIGFAVLTVLVGIVAAIAILKI